MQVVAAFTVEIDQTYENALALRVFLETFLEGCLPACRILLLTVDFTEV